ncbi:hypothetical protein GCM10027063_39390 [Promicromonospora xylanilytica]
MNARPVGVVMDVDSEGHVAVSVDEEPWIPPGPGGIAPEVRLGRSDVPWVLDQLLTTNDGPLHVVLHDGGRIFTDVVTRDRLAYLGPRPAQLAEPSRPDSTPTEPPSGTPTETGRLSSGWFEAGGYTPGEQVAVAVVITRLAADERGAVGFTLPAALRAMVGDVVAIGEESREIYVNQADHEPLSLRAIREALNSPTRSGPAPGSDDLDHGFRSHADGPQLGR